MSDSRVVIGHLLPFKPSDFAWNIIIIDFHSPTKELPAHDDIIPNIFKLSERPLRCSNPYCKFLKALKLVYSVCTTIPSQRWCRITPAIPYKRRYIAGTSPCRRYAIIERLISDLKPNLSAWSVISNLIFPSNAFLRLISDLKPNLSI
jgi:hypothetical protein